MIHRLHLLGLNHGTAPLAVREKLAFNGPQRADAVAAFRARFAGTEAVLLSTCNRVELYSAATTVPPPTREEVIDFLAAFHRVPAEQFAPHLYHKAGREAVGHVFTVAASLDSMVLGESQILGQVRDAYDCARGLDACGPLLHALFQRAIAVGKQVLNETAIGEGRLSVASVAVDYARQIFDHFGDKTVLNIGAGKMASLVLRHLADLRPGRLLVCNRNAGRAADLAGQFGGQAVPFEQLDAHLVAADIVVSSTGSPEPIITRARFERLLRPRKYRPVFMIDIALPRDIEQSLEELDNVYLYNLDHLQEVVSKTQSLRKDAIAAARAIVAGQVEEFISWHRTRELGPAIDGLYRRYHQLARDELARTLNKLPNVGEAERVHLEDLARRIVNKLLHDPVTVLRRSGGGTAGHAPADQYVHALQKLFRLDADPGPVESDPPAGKPE